MTADELATLARVERLLAPIGGFAIEDNRRIEAALALIRGLLAEPQPDESESIYLRAVLAEGVSVEEMLEAMDDVPAEIYVLGEPQVNPSEAKDLLRIIKVAADALERDGVAPGVQNYLLNAHATFGAGLLAEGEESREP